MYHYNISQADADRLIADRGPRWVTQIGLGRDGRVHLYFVDTAEEAERIYDKHVDEGGYQLVGTRVIPPAGSGDLAAAKRARVTAKAAFDEATDVLRAAVLRAIEDGRSEHEVARSAGVDRMTVRSWLGKR